MVNDPIVPSEPDQPLEEQVANERRERREDVRRLETEIDRVRRTQDDWNTAGLDRLDVERLDQHRILSPHGQAFWLNRTPEGVALLETNRPTTETWNGGIAAPGTGGGDSGDISGLRTEIQQLRGELATVDNRVTNALQRIAALRNDLSLHTHEPSGGGSPSEPPPEPDPPTVEGTPIHPGDNYQAAITAAAIGETLVLDPGATYPNWNVSLRNDQTVGTSDPSNPAILDGTYTQSRAFKGTADGITIQDVIIEHYTSGHQDGPIEGSGGEDWTVQRCEIRYNGDYGIRVGDGMHIIDCHIHHNRTLAIDGKSDPSARTGRTGKIQNTIMEYQNWKDQWLDDGSAITDAEVDALLRIPNGTWARTEFQNVSPYWEAGGFKIVRSHGFQAIDCVARKNNGVGLWFDILNVDCDILGGSVEENTLFGANHEIGNGGLIDGLFARHNTLEPERRDVGVRGDSWGWGAQIGLQNEGGSGSRPATVRNCTVVVRADQGDGITVISTPESGQPTVPRHPVDNVLIENNVIRYEGGTGQSGNFDSVSGGSITNVVWRNNTYQFVGQSNQEKADRWHHGNNRNWSEWRSAGFDGNSTVTHI